MTQPANENPQDQKYTIWIVEDNNAFGRQLADLLNLSQRFICDHTFTSCEQALDLLRTGELPDIVLMDIGLPGMSGIEGVRQIKTIASSAEVVILTVFEESEKVFEAISAGASGYLHKSSSLELIVESLESILAGGAPINPQIARKVLEMFAHLATPQGDYHLSPREKEILRLLVDGLTKKEIAGKLFLSFHTIDNHLRNIYAKLRVQSRSSAVSKALKERLL